MKVAVERTGGLVVLSESFGHSVFKDSFRRVFEDGEQSLGLCSKCVISLIFIHVYLCALGWSDWSGGHYFPVVFSLFLYFLKICFGFFVCSVELLYQLISIPQLHFLCLCNPCKPTLETVFCPP